MSGLRLLGYTNKPVRRRPHFKGRFDNEEIKGVQDLFGLSGKINCFEAYTYTTHLWPFCFCSGETMLGISFLSGPCVACVLVCMLFPQIIMIMAAETLFPSNILGRLAWNLGGVEFKL